MSTSLDKHTASLGNRLVDIILLRELMNCRPSVTLRVNDPSLLWQISPNHRYWNDTEGRPLGPCDLFTIENWETAETEYPLWKEHIQKVKNADLNYPIWLCDMPDTKDPSKRIEVIFDGMHRYTKAKRDNLQDIKAIKVRLEELPEKYFIG